MNTCSMPEKLFTKYVVKPGFPFCRRSNRPGLVINERSDSCKTRQSWRTASAMMFLKESLYGWGVCNIPMPRATLDVLWDRRKKRARVASLERRRQSERPGILASISGVLVHDVPWFQTLALSFFALLSITFIFLIEWSAEETVTSETSG